MAVPPATARRTRTQADGRPPLNAWSSLAVLRGNDVHAALGNSQRMVAPCPLYPAGVVRLPGAYRRRADSLFPADSAGGIAATGPRGILPLASQSRPL